MIKLDTPIQGQQMRFGDIYPYLLENRITLGGNWEYDEGMFDGAILQDGPDTIYLRMPFEVLSGMVDDPDAVIVFGQPFLIKHVVNVGLDHEGADLLATTGLNQFQSPAEKDAEIHHKSHWEEEGERIVQELIEGFPLLSDRPTN